MNHSRIAAALRALADAFETPADTADLPPVKPAKGKKAVDAVAPAADVVT
jgi:hypothetical protein